MFAAGVPASFSGRSSVRRLSGACALGRRVCLRMHRYCVVFHGIFTPALGCSLPPLSLRHKPYHRHSYGTHPHTTLGLVLSCLSGHQACPRCIGCSVPAAIWAVALRGPPSRGFISSALAWVRQDHDRIGSRPEEYVEADETGFTKLSHSNGTIRVIPPMMVDWQEDVWNAMLWKSK